MNDIPTLVSVGSRTIVSENDPAVIIVDDDPSILRALSRLLRLEGFTVVTFERPSDVLASEFPKSDACLLVDVHLPEMNGAELCRRLAGAGCLLPVILMTAHPDSRTASLMKHVDKVATLAKPFSRAVLLDAVEKALAAGASEP